MSGDILDDFQDLTGWTAIASGQARLQISRAPGRQGGAMRLDFDFQGGGGFVVARKRFDLTLPESYVISFDIRGRGPGNILEFKLVDASKAFMGAREDSRSQSAAAISAIKTVVDDRAAAASRNRASSTFTMSGTLGAALAFALIVGVVLSRLITRPITMLTAAMRRLATGDTDMALDLAGRKDEICGMFGAVRVFRDNAIERRHLAEQTEAEHAHDQQDPHLFPHSFPPSMSECPDRKPPTGRWQPIRERGHKRYGAASR